MSYNMQFIRELIIMDYKKMYLKLFSAITDALEEIGQSKVISTEIKNAESILKSAQIKTEEMYTEQN